MSTFSKSKLFAIGMLYALNGTAQSLIPDRNMMPDVQVRGALPVVSLRPADPSAPRIVAQVRRSAGAGAETVDSIHYRYSGSDHRHPGGGIMYSERVRMQTRPQGTTGWRSRPVYNADKSLASVLIQRWDTACGTWENTERQSYTYRLRRLVRDTAWSWNAASQGWTPATTTQYNRNADGRPMRIVSLQWNARTGALDSVADLRYQLDAAGNVTECLSRYGTGRLHPATRQEVGYNDAGQLTSLFEYSWDSVAAVWNRALGYRFITGSRGERLMQLNYWGGSDEAFGRYLYRYDAAGLLSHMEYQTISGRDGTWQLAERYEYGYDQDGRRVTAQRQGIRQESSDRQIAGQISDRTEFHYEPLAMGTGSVPQGTELRIWPVPARTQLHLDIRSVGGQAYHATITDLQGRSLKRWSRTAGSAATDELDLDGIPSGTYNLVVRTAAGRSYTARFIVAG